MKKLSKDEMKKVMGGLYQGGGDGWPCWTTSECQCNEKCVWTDIGSQGTCQSISLGSSCNVTSDCGAGQICQKFQPPMSGGYCITGNGNL